MKNVLLLLFILNSSFSYSQQFFQKTFGGGNNEYGFSHKKLPDGSYVIAGRTYSFGAGGYDAYLIKTDNTGNLLWSKTYGGNYDEFISEVFLTPDKGFILAGSRSYNGNATFALYLIKIDSIGQEQWSKTYYDDNLHNHAKQILPTSDGGYIVVGNDQYYVPLFKIDASGNLIFSYKYDIQGSGISFGESIAATSDGGYILSGYVRNNQYYNDLFLIKINAIGVVQWTKSYGGPGGSMYGNDIVILPDESIVVAGYTDAFGKGKTDLLLLKTDASGNLQWVHVYGGTDYDESRKLASTCDGGFIMTGSARSFKNGVEDIILLKTNALGNMEWSKVYGGLLYDVAENVTTDGCDIIITGTTFSYGAGSSDVFFLKLNSQGNDGKNCNIKTITPTQTNPTIVQTNLGNNRNPWQNETVVLNTVNSPTTIQSDSVCKTCVSPVSDFDFVQNIMSVNFLNFSKNGTTYSWDFGDGSTDNNITTIHKYSAPGTYSVKLVSRNECGKDSIIKKITIANAPYCFYNTQPGPSRGYDTYVWSRNAFKNSNMYTSPVFNMNSWTWGGEPGDQRTFFKFDLNEVCNLSDFLGANLSLYYPTGLALTAYLHSGSNAFTIYRVTDPWELKTITWNNQAAYTTDNSVGIPVTPPYSSINNLDVTNLVKDMVTYGNNGFMSKLNTEATYRSAIYAASDWPVASERPLLQLKFNPLIANVSFTDSIICPGDSVQLNASGGIRYQWLPEQGLSCTDCANPKANPGIDLEYTVNIYSCENCAEVKKVKVHYPQPLRIDNHYVYVCKNDSVKLIASNLNNYQWSPALYIDTVNIATPTVFPPKTMFYTVTGSSGGGCLQKDSIKVVVDAPPSLKVDTFLCAAGSLFLDLSKNGGSYVWSDGSTDPYFVAKDTGKYWVEVSNNCGTTRDSFEIKTCCERLSIHSLFKEKTISHCFDDGENISIHALWGKTFDWTESNSHTSYMTVEKPGTYAVTAFDEYGCPVKDSIDITQKCNPRIFVPEAFSPNNDGHNDQMEIFGKYFKNFELKIFNRWGEIIFISNDRNIQWDGNYRGKEMPIGTYPWIINYESIYDDDEKPKTMKGSITVVR